MDTRRDLLLCHSLSPFAVMTLCAAALTFAGSIPRAGAQALPSGTPASVPPTSDATGAAINAAVPTAAGIGGISPGLGGNQIAGNLNYSFTASEIVSTGSSAYSNGSGVASATNVGGQATFVSGSERHPTSFIYSGGYFFSNGNGFQSSSYQNLGISQVLSVGRLSVVATDLVSYLPSSPIFGLSGVAGTGDIGAPPIGVGATPTQSVLTNYGRRISNTASLTAGESLTGATAINVSGAYTLLHFLDGTGLDSDQTTAAAGLNHRFDARNSGGGYYSFSKYSYGESTGALTGINALGNLSYTSQSVGVDFSHLFTRQLSISVSAGPQFTSSSQPALFPSQTSAAVSASLSYTQPRTTYALSYSQGTNAGSGVFVGSVSKDVNFTANHRFSRDWNGSVSANYGRARALTQFVLGNSNATTDSFYAGIQASRRLGSILSAYASYNIQTQSIGNSGVALNAYNGTSNIFSFGLSVSPRPIHVGRR